MQAARGASLSYDDPGPTRPADDPARDLGWGCFAVVALAAYALDLGTKRGPSRTSTGRRHPRRR